MMCLTEGKHRGIGEAIWEQSTAWFQRKKPRAESRKIHRQLGQGSGRHWKEMREGKQASVDLPSSLFFCCYWPFHHSLQATKARWDRLVSAAQFPPTTTIWETTLLMVFPDVCVILVFVSLWICSFSSDLCVSAMHCTCIKTSHCTAESTRILSG